MVTYYIICITTRRVIRCLIGKLAFYRLTSCGCHSDRICIHWYLFHFCSTGKYYRNFFSNGSRLRPEQHRRRKRVLIDFDANRQVHRWNRKTKHTIVFVNGILVRIYSSKRGRIVSDIHQGHLLIWRIGEENITMSYPLCYLPKEYRVLL